MDDDVRTLVRGCATLLLIGLVVAVASTIIGTSDPYADTLKQIRQDAALRRVLRLTQDVAQDAVLTRAAMPTRTATPFDGAHDRPTPTMTPTATSTPTATPIYGAPVAEK
jgi:hypothetical protein